MLNDAIITLCDLSGQAIAELDGHVDDVSYRLNGVGVANLSIAYDSAPRGSLRLGSRVVIQFLNGLPTFGGIIDYPLQQHVHSLGIRVYSGEHIFNWRRVSAELTGARGTIAEKLLSLTNSTHPTGIVPGVFIVSGQSLTRSYSRELLLDILRELADTQDFVVTPSFENSQLKMEFSWYAQRGQDRRNDVLLAAADVRSSRQGPIRNHITAVGNGITAVAQDAASIADHDRREHTIYFNDVDSAMVLQDLADQYVAKWRRGGHRLTLHNVGGDYSLYDVGDIVSLEAMMDKGAWALKFPVRILARSWTPTDACTLEVEEIV